MERFDFIVPSGYFCVTGYHLRHARLHGETLPFDWLDGVTPELFAGFLESRFRDFLELPQLIPEGKKEEGDGHYRFRMPSGDRFCSRLCPSGSGGRICGSKTEIRPPHQKAV